MACIELTESNFNEVVTNHDILIIDFWAQWCGPCKQFGPIFEKVANQNPDVAFAKVNADTEQGLAGHFQIQSIPTVMVIKEKSLVFNQAGSLDEQNLTKLVDQVKELDMEKVHAETKAESSKE